MTSTIIGARNVEQLEQNLGALEVTLKPAHMEKLNTMTTPTLDFPAPFLLNVPSFMHGGVHVNGIDAPPSPFGVRPDSPKY